MTAGHALVVALSAGSGYRHIVQAPAVELAILLVGAGALAAARRLFRTAGDRHTAPDWALPSLAAIRALGPVQIVCAVLAIQLSALVAGESLEQHLSGVALPGFAGAFGSTLAVAPLIHVAIGAAFALLLWIVAREAYRHATEIVGFGRAIVAWLARPTPLRVPKLGRIRPAASFILSQPLAFKLANRPPPSSVRHA